MRPPLVVVSGLINLETTVRIPGFPLDYAPVHYPFGGVASTVSGVGYNVAKALTSLGHPVRLLSLVGRDLAAEAVETELRRDGLDPAGVLPDAAATAASVILYEASGRRQIHVDLKDLQDRRYPVGRFVTTDAAAVVLANIGFSRSLLGPARDRGLPIVTDVHVLSDPADPYNQEFLEAADLVFLSNEACVGSELDLARALLDRYPCRLVVVGRGAEGALLVERGRPPVAVGAVKTRPVVSTIGAGDALLSAFVAGWTRGLSPEAALRRATVFASWKIGTAGAAQGFLSEADLDACAQTALR